VDKPQSKTPLRNRLFIGKQELQLWVDNISPSNIELLQHVRSFNFRDFVLDRQSSTYNDIEDLYVYFPSFHKLHSISLSNARISSDIPERMEMFSPCQQVLSSLTLFYVSLSWRSFIVLIDYFPNLRHLELSCLSFEDEDTRPPSLSRPLRGRLSFYWFKEAIVKAFSNWLSTVPGVEYDELVVGVGYGSAPYFQQIIIACGKSLKRLELQICECFVSRTML
jgi:hypothetical protein